MEFLIPVICIAVVGGSISVFFRHQDEMIVPELDLAAQQSKQHETA